MHAMTRREVLSLATTSFLGLSLFPFNDFRRGVSARRYIR